ncbi:hypothetical protein ABPG75_002699 [Micractinium tetrahymenae]
MLWIPIFPDASPTLSTWAMTLGVGYATMGLLAGILTRVAGKPPPSDPAASIGYDFALLLTVLAGILLVFGLLIVH